MARFDVHANSHGEGYLLDVQATMFEDFKTRVVVPLLPANIAPKPAARLNPCFAIGGVRVVMLTHLLSAVPTQILGPPISNLEHRSPDIVDAIDFLMQGF